MLITEENRAGIVQRVNKLERVPIRILRDRVNRGSGNRNYFQYIGKTGYLQQLEAPHTNGFDCTVIIGRDHIGWSTVDLEVIDDEAE